MLGTKISKSLWAVPQKTPLTGCYVHLEPLSLEHLPDLWQNAQVAPESFAYLRYGPFEEKSELETVLADLSTRADQPFWAVIGPEGKALGWLSICDVHQSDGALEIGNIWFSPALQGTREGREAIFLLMSSGMDTLEYERLVWRCQTQNEKSCKAAINLGFVHEGTWRNAAIIDGWQRDVAWHSILKDEWPVHQKALETWLRPTNFDPEGSQISSLREIRNMASTV